MTTWTVQATDQDTLQEVGRLESGVINEDIYIAGNVIELSENGYVAEFHAYRVADAGEPTPEPGTIGYDMCVSVRLAEPASAYRDVFTTLWDASDAE